MDSQDTNKLKLTLLEMLFENSRENAEDIAEKLKKSRQTISKLRQQLWSKETIQYPTILLNPYALNLQYFFMEIRTNPAEPELLAKLKKIPEIRSIDGIIGEYALIVKFEERTKQRFAEILNGIEQSMTQTLFQSYHIIETIDVFKLGGIILNRSIPLKKLDDKKWRILELLRKNHNPKKWPERKPNEFFIPEEQEFLEKLNLSREYEYFINENIIEQFTIALNPITPDFKIKLYMRIKPKAIGQYTSLAEKLIYEPNIIDLFRTGEDRGLLAVIRTKDLRDFRELINHLYQSYEILDTHTTVVVDEDIPSIFPPTLEIAKKTCTKK